MITAPLSLRGATRRGNPRALVFTPASFHCREGSPNPAFTASVPKPRAERETKRIQLEPVSRNCSSYPSRPSRDISSRPMPQPEQTEGSRDARDVPNHKPILSLIPHLTSLVLPLSPNHQSQHFYRCLSSGLYPRYPRQNNPAPQFIPIDYHPASHLRFQPASLSLVGGGLSTFKIHSDSRLPFPSSSVPDYKTIRLPDHMINHSLRSRSPRAQS